VRTPLAWRARFAAISIVTTWRRSRPAGPIATRRIELAALQRVRSTSPAPSRRLRETAARIAGVRLHKAVAMQRATDPPTPLPPHALYCPCCGSSDLQMLEVGADFRMIHVRCATAIRWLAAAKVAPDNVTSTDVLSGNCADCRTTARYSRMHMRDDIRSVCDASPRRETRPSRHRCSPNQSNENVTSPDEK
jgi:hypothetical protein